jgi:Ulp1 family protease
MQENGYNCGIYLCRYATAMYYLQDVETSYSDFTSDCLPLMNKLIESHYMDKFRAEILLLIQKLSSLYSTRNAINLLTQTNEEDAMFSVMKSAGEDTGMAIPDALFSAMNFTQEEFTAALIEAEFSGMKSNEEETAKAATDATFSALQNTEEETTETATDVTFSGAKSGEKETIDGQVDEEDEYVAAVVGEKVSPAPYKEVITIGPTLDSVLKSMKESFYRVYSEHFETVRVGGTTVLTRQQYDHKVQLLIDAESKHKGWCVHVDFVVS